MSVLSELNRLIDYAIKANNLPDKVLVPASEKYLRKKLRLKKAQPLAAVGSKEYQRRQEKGAEARFNAAQIDAFPDQSGAIS